MIEWINEWLYFLNWFNSYLYHQNEYTEFNQIRFLILKVICGVPEGSILGPIIFLVYINDITYCTDISLFSFADDNTLYMSHAYPAVLYNTINNELVKLNDSFCANRLSLNVKKTKYALFNQSIKIPNLPQNTAIILNCINLIRIGNVWPEETIKVTWCRASKHVDHQLIIPHNEIHVRDITIY